MSLYLKRVRNFFSGCGCRSGIVAKFENGRRDGQRCDDRQTQSLQRSPFSKDTVISRPSGKMSDQRFHQAPEAEVKQIHALL